MTGESIKAGLHHNPLKTTIQEIVSNHHVHPDKCIKLLKRQNRMVDIAVINPLDITILPAELQLKQNEPTIKKRIAEAMTSLSPRQREIIYLKFYNNLDYDELAEILDINYQSVVNHIHKAMLKLRKADVLQHFKY